VKLDRVLGIIVLLLNREKASAKELAERFGVTIRTIYRDLETIDAAGIPVIARGGPGGGYGIDPDYSVDRSIMGAEDLSAAVGALKGVHEAIGDPSIGSALDKLGGLMRRGGKARTPEERVVVDLFPWGKREDERELARTVERAIAEKRVLRFAYASYGRPAEERAVEPMTLVFKSYAWYLWGYCRLRGGYRLFKLARMRNTRTALERFKRRADAYRPAELGAGVELMEVLLRFDPERSADAEEWFAQDDVRAADDGRLEVTLRVPRGAWMVNTLLGFGPGVEVVEPASLRAAMAEAAGKIVKSNG